MKSIMVALLAALAFFGMAVVVTAAAPRDFDHPASTDTAQQFAAASVQRADTPNDPEYDYAEPDDEDGAPTTTNLFDERWDLYGFPSQLTASTAVYRDPVDALRSGKPMVSGYNAGGAWKLTRGRGDVVIAILDTGIRWDRSELRRRVHLNCGELPAPHNAAGVPVAGSAPGCKESSFSYDLNGNGVLDVDDYANDARVTALLADASLVHYTPGKVNGHELIRAFSDGTDDDGNGFIDDIAGWDFFNNDNDPYDQSSYFAAGNHGSGRASDAVEETNDGSGGLGVCPRCQFLPMRVWDTFVADPNNFGMAVVYAVDNGAKVIEGADGALGHTQFMEFASEYAYQKGAVQTYSGNDLNTGDHNYPANYSHTMLIEGTVPDVMGLGKNVSSGCGLPSQFPPQFGDGCDQVVQAAAAALTGSPVPVGTALPVTTYFRGANTTQYGGHSSISMEGSTGSENTGKAAGAAGMVISAFLTAHPAQSPPRPDEVRAILEQTAEDITPLNTVGHGAPDASQVGWDTHFGWGRVDLGAAVALAASANVPPEAAIHAPDWYAPSTGKTLHITGLARARFATGGALHWKLEWGTGLAPTSYTVVRESNATGVVNDFGTIDLDAVRTALASAALPAADAGMPVFAPGGVDPYASQFSVRLTVTGTGLTVPGVDRRVYTAFTDSSLRAGFPRFVNAGGEAPLRYADLDGDNVPELIVPTEDGVLRVLKKDGSALAGFPVMTQLQMQAANHLTAPGFATLVPFVPPREELRGAAVGDLDGDGIPEIIDAAGIHVYVWNHDGTVHTGFPVSLDLNNCKGADQKQDNVHRKCGFIGSPALGHLEGADKPLDIVAAGLDGHLYAWRGNGSLLPGFPVNLVDPAVAPANQVLAESINNPAIGDLDGDGKDDVVIATNETYGADNPSPSDLPGLEAAALADALAAAAGSSSRVYAVSGKDGSFLPGWPLHLNGAVQETLPLVGPGHDAALVKIGGTPSVIVSTTGGALAQYGANGALVRGYQQGIYGAASNATDRSGQFNLFESASVGDLTGLGRPSVVKYGISLAQVTNLLLVGQNTPYNHLIGAYDAQTGVSLPAYPTITDDYQFLSASNIGNVSGTGNQVLAGTGLGLVHAYDGVTAQDASGFPKITGGWLFAPPELSQDHRMAAITREGFLFEWDVANAPACQPEWPTFRHDPHNSGNYNHDGTPPGAITDLKGTADPAGLKLTWTAQGSDGACQTGAADHYVLTVDGTKLTTGVPVPGAPGAAQSVVVSGASTSSSVTLQAVDAAGNLGYPARLNAGGSTGSSTGSTTGSTTGGPTGGNVSFGSGSSGGAMAPLGSLLFALGFALRRRRKGKHA